MEKTVVVVVVCYLAVISSSSSSSSSSRCSYHKVCLSLLQDRTFSMDTLPLGKFKSTDIMNMKDLVEIHVTLLKCTKELHSSIDIDDKIESTGGYRSPCSFSGSDSI